MSEVKEKPVKIFFKKVGKIIKPILRGALKSVPILNPIIEITENIRNEVKSNSEVKKHNYVSIIIQIICVSSIIYAFATKQITVEQLLQLLNFNPSDQAISN